VRLTVCLCHCRRIICSHLEAAASKGGQQAAQATGSAAAIVTAAGAVELRDVSAAPPAQPRFSA
jgi:hypothetical protein